MISYDLADRFIPEIKVRDWHRAARLFPDYAVNSSPDHLGLARRVKTWLEPRIKRIALEELDEMYYAMRRAKQEIYVAAEDNTISHEDTCTLIYMLRELFEDRKLYMLQSIELIHSVMLPNVEPKSAGFMVLWPDQKGRHKGREGRIMVRSGKGIRRMFPCLSDKEVEMLNDAYRHEFSIKELTIKSGQTRADFAHAKHGTIGKVENPDTSHARKNLNNSCMRYDFTDRHRLTHQPTEAYASGDFTIYWTEDDKGHICSNCIVYDGSEKGTVAAPIYGVCEKSMDKLQDHLSDLGIEMYSYHNNKSWQGAKLLRFDHSEDEYIAPYLDVAPQSLRTSCDGKFLVVDRCGEISATTYQGILYGSSQTCDICDDGIRRDAQMHFNDNVYCQDCYSDNISQCSYCGDDEANDEMTTVQTATSDYEQYCPHCVAQHTVVTNNGETWLEEDTILTADGLTISCDDYNSDYFTSDWDNGIYINDLLETLENGDIVAASELVDNGNYYYCDTDCVWKEKTDDDDDDHQKATHTESEMADA